MLLSFEGNFMNALLLELIRLKLLDIGDSYSLSEHSFYYEWVSFNCEVWASTKTAFYVSYFSHPSLLLMC